MSVHPGKKPRVTWSIDDSDSEESLEHKQDGPPLESKAPPENQVFSRLGELHTDILSTAEVVKQVQKEVLRLRQENETLRRKLSLVGLSVAEGEEPGLRASAGPVNSLMGKNSDGPRAPATAPARMQKPEPPTEPEVVLPFSPEEEETQAPAKKRPMKTETAQSMKEKASRDDSMYVPVETTKTSVFGWGIQNKNKRTLGPPSLKKPHSQRASQDSFVSRMSKRGSYAQDAKRDDGVRAMLFDPEMVKEQLKKNIIKPDFNVNRYYHKEGCVQSIARSHTFENISLAVICLNTLWIAVDTEHNRADVLLDADIGFQVVEHLFCTFFFFEILIRFAAFEDKRNCIRSGWFIFDGSLVITMVIEDWVMTIVLLATSGGTGGTGKSVSAIKNTAILRVLRLIRLARLGRCLKLMRQSPEVMIMVKAIAASMRCVVWTTVLLACMMFFFGVCFTQLCKETRLEEKYFPSLTTSLHTLMIAGLFPDLEGISKSINKESIFFWLIFVFYLVMTTICVLNLLIGVLVEVVKASSSIERDAMDVAYVKQVFVSTLELTEVEDFSNIYVCKEEVAEILQDNDILQAMRKVGIDVIGLVDLMDFIFIKGAVGFAELLETVLQLRSSADVTVKDLVEVRKFLTYEINKMKLELKQIHSDTRHQAKTLEAVAESLEVEIPTFVAACSSRPAKSPALMHKPFGTVGSELALADM